MDLSAALVPRASTEIAMAADDARRAETLTEIWLRSFKSAHTRVNYRRDLTAWLEWCAQCGVHPRDARIAHADMWIEKQRQEGAAESSIARRVSAISSWYGYLIINTAEDPVPLATRNPGKTRAKPKISPDYSPTVGLSRIEADRLIGEADRDSQVASALIRILLTEGLRIGSVIDAMVTDLGHDRGHRTLTLTVKGGTPNRIPLPAPTGEAIDAMLAARDWPVDGPLYLTTTGRPLYEMWVWRLIRRLGRQASIPQAAKMKPHSLRHTAITELLDSGASLRDVQDFAGHRDPRTTRRYDRARGNLDRHGSYVLATRYGVRHDG